MSLRRRSSIHPPAKLPGVDLKTDDEQPTLVGVNEASRGSNPEPPIFLPELEYKNSLLAAVGFLELTNSLDFPANVWNNVPVPLFAQILQGLGGGIAILYTYFAFWDSIRCWRNVKFLLQERAYLKKRRRDHQSLLRVEQAWLDVNFRELGWECIDRLVMDIMFGVGGIIVGAGTLLAIRGDIPAVFLASNLLSGYIGNSVLAVYAVFATGWSYFVTRRAFQHIAAVNKAKNHVDPSMRVQLQDHARRHQTYAVLNGISVLVSGAGSLVSATLWPGYVILIPCIFGSAFCNWYWRHKLGYGRRSIQKRKFIEECDPFEQLQTTIAIYLALSQSSSEPSDLCEIICKGGQKSADTVISFMKQSCLYEDFYTYQQGQGIDTEKPLNDQQAVERSMTAANHCIIRARKSRLRDEIRFWLELYGCYLCVDEQNVPSPSDDC